MHKLEDSLKEKQSIIDRLQSSIHYRSNNDCTRAGSPLPQYTSYQIPYTNHALSIPTTLTHPTLPSYDQHLHGTRYSNHHPSLSPIPVYETGSHSFPNTPETIRKRASHTIVPTRSNSGSSLVPQRAGGGIYKSLTPPPAHYPRSRPPLIASHSVSHNGLRHDIDQSRRDQYYRDIDSLDDSIESLSSQSSLSPPTHYQIGSRNYNNSIHEHSNSFPNYSHQQ